VQILKGLQPGDEVVTEGGTALDDGMKVHIAGARR
jgi:preprotein translocase subunit YajC